MSRDKKNNKLINFSEILFVISFFILVVVTIYFISNGLSSPDIKMELVKLYSVDQANAIKAVADSTVSRINNVIAVSAIFFTVAVATISVFQYLKIKDIDRTKDRLINEVEKSNKFIGMKLAKNNKKFNELENMYSHKLNTLEETYIKDVNKIQYMISELESKIKELDLKNIEFEIDTNYVQIQELMTRKDISSMEVINHYKKIINLCELHPIIKNNEFLSEIYIKFSSFYIFTYNEFSDYEYINEILNKAIDMTCNPIKQSEAYRALLKLNRILNKGLDKEIFYLEKIIEENYADLDSTLELAIVLDKRNNIGDLEKCINLLKSTIEINVEAAKELIINYNNKGEFNNLTVSEFADDFYKLLK